MLGFEYLYKIWKYEAKRDAFVHRMKRIVLYNVLT